VKEKSRPTFAVIYTTDEKSSVNEVVTGRDAVYASIYRNVDGLHSRLSDPARMVLGATPSWTCPPVAPRTSFRGQ